MKPISLIRIALVLAFSGATPANAKALYSLTATLPWISKNSTSVGLGIVVNGTYYLSDRTNAVVHVVDIASSTETGQIHGFVGATVVNGTVNKPMSGPNGLLYIPNQNELYVGNGDDSVKVVDLGNLTVVDTISLGISKRADEMTYDANRKLAIVTGPDDDIAILAFISVADRQLNPSDGLIYVSVPESNDNPGGEIDVIESANFTTNKILPVSDCSSHGIVFGHNQQLLLGCSQDAILADSVGHTLVIDVTTGKTIETIDGIGGADQVAYNPTLNFYYVAAYQYQVNGSKTGDPDLILGIIDTATGTLIQTIKTDNITAHAVAVDPKTKKMFVPLAKSGIAIYDLVNGTTAGNASTTGTPTGGTSTSTATSTAKASGTPSAAMRAGAWSISLFLPLLLVAAVGVGSV